ncbi:hypothetical protein [Bradyrhizobium sp. SZCCHNRI2007]|uniref:hypothetical protein n=1 Tax=Bradyrhizobium sp. SZCCHNRI2007 TaxID=3057281 RepID=UPI0028EEC726|nr:hypothetical protein [Bradyrhizobium sp. SZCCHNRI2007]
MTGFRFFAFRVDLETGAAIAAAAKAANVSLSGWLREAVRMRLPEGTSLPTLPPSPRRRPVHIPDADVAAVACLLGGINRLNGAMIQLAKSLREAGHAPEHQAMEAAIHDVGELKTEGVNLFRRLQE